MKTIFKPHKREGDRPTPSSEERKFKKRKEKLDFCMKLIFKYSIYLGILLMNITIPLLIYQFIALQMRKRSQKKRRQSHHGNVVVSAWVAIDLKTAEDARAAKT